MYKYLFGPVPSRRLGRSLGVDIVPLKTCSYNCVFCQAGITTQGTVERGEYVPTADVIREFESWIAAGGTSDYITFSGSGEPTLHSGIGEIISSIRRVSDSRIALLTNSSLLYRPDVRDEINSVDLIKASLSAWSNESLAAINRPYGDIGVVQLIDGLKNLRREFKGTMWIEVFILAGINDDDKSVRHIADIVETIRPEKVHLNTVVRPPAERSAQAVPPERLAVLSKFFDPPAEAISQVKFVRKPDEVGNRPVMDALRAEDRRQKTDD